MLKQWNSLRRVTKRLEPSPARVKTVSVTRFFRFRVAATGSVALAVKPILAGAALICGSSTNEVNAMALILT